MLIFKLPKLKKIEFNIKIINNLEKYNNGYNILLQNLLKNIETMDIQEWDLYRDLSNDYELI